ncbi:MAG: hypothetical protein DKM50_08015 [Candidatus Margulisiibacteriota bacterium]|nr:MAG: hypothetical protein A2X43_10015 [Candidatus Margulisbacteria bacterium GWD2_39_127]OGI03099.1 MAG: hypothetical protein A2X42_00490 [Candidatus Margulisbacteria bacterium GWF2_38_17]OGI07687.1 MAG: hypothetical protein A2X41_04625 [Candidatus Margulisbacteria bacterium GWE2_39_32]PZM79640.1 MAG: hypothetical protein DKM50_08015 [Candidatus Margulisiibacteriota bacterium]HAR61892.1 hypothetical protein [Candidatus Margulisiibacteriota bacterium]
MGFFVKTLASSSRGNAALVFTRKTRILIDAGISFRRIKEALNEIQIPLESLSAVLITHAHSDHVKGLPLFISKTDIPIFCSKRTSIALLRRKEFQGIAALMGKINFYDGKTIRFDDISVDSYPFPHGGWLLSGIDHAGEHTCFKLTYTDKGTTRTVGFATDIGCFPHHLIEPYYNCDLYVIEANHDVGQQLISSRPAGLIKRNLSDTGHLSNDQAADALVKLIHPEPHLRRTKHIHLAHLSRDCNCHELASNVIKCKLQSKGYSEINVTTAPYDVPSEIFHVK